jgi:hypothetical protein
MRINSSGHLLIGKTADDNTTTGIALHDNGFASIAREANIAFLLDRSNAGEIMRFTEGGAAVGTINTLAGVGIAVVFRTDSSGMGITSSGTRLVPTDHNANTTDNVSDLGKATLRWQDVYATNGTIQTSDRNEKQDIAALTSAEMLVAKRISALFKTFRWKDKVAVKGDDARTHSGIIAQDVQAAFEAESLDAGDYSMFTSTTWWEHDVDVAAVEADDIIVPPIEAVDAYTRIDKYDTEDEAPEGSTSRTRLGIRYPELLSFLAAYNEQRFAAIETRLTALEG